MLNFVIAFLLFAIYDFIALKLGYKVPLINYKSSFKDKYFYKYELLRLIIISVIMIGKEYITTYI